MTRRIPGGGLVPALVLALLLGAVPEETAEASSPIRGDDALLDAPVVPLRGQDPLPGAVDERGRVSFLLRVRDMNVPYPVLGVTALPGETLDLGVMESWGEGGLEGFRLRSAEGVVEPRRPGVWRWTAPRESGPVALRVESPVDGQVIHLNVFVLHPWSRVQDGRLDGFRIGEYRSRNDPPRGFIAATRRNLDIRVAPDFTLRQFMPKQPGDPAYMASSGHLFLKVQAVLDEVRARGIPARTLTVMSGYRTPHYNRAIGNTTDSSRHLWGDAADIFVDLNGNGRMDDLNGDGRVDVEDARWLAGLVERVENQGEPHVRIGGIGIYRSNPVRGPFVHVDARGHRARW
jgi:hypothetical protein